LKSCATLPPYWNSRSCVTLELKVENARSASGVPRLNAQ
jgi:hypothetical protein